MLWYEVPCAATMTVLIILLTTSIMQALIALEAGELIREKPSLRLIRTLYGILATVFFCLSMEVLLAVASIEGGVFLPISYAFRYASVLPLFLFPYAVKAARNLPAGLRPPAANFFIPLLLLPPSDLLPAPLAFLLVAFVSAWFALDTAKMLLAFRACARQEITRGVIAHVIRSFYHGVCVANERGWILEANPAFYRLCETLGIQAVERTDEFDRELQALTQTGRLVMDTLPMGRSVRTDSGVYLLRQSGFQSGAKTYTELSLSDVTHITRTAAELEHENNALELENRRLEQVISAIEREAAVLERDRLCRAAHDLWSQRLALAGLSIDLLLRQKDTGAQCCGLEEIEGILEPPAEAESVQMACGLYESLKRLTGMYQRLGVMIDTSGQAEFTAHEQEALCAVLKEAFANAVRHGYARRIDLIFHRNENTAGVVIRNDCVDEEPDITEGRGLHDIKTRIRHAGGWVVYKKDSHFELQVTFPRENSDAEEAGAS